MPDHAWTAADLPDLDGVRAVVTGANSGLGFHTTLELARRGAHVVLGVRDEARGADAVEQVLRQVPGARLEVRPLDLADLASVRAFAGRTGDEGTLDLLVDNAGIMAVPYRATADGFEAQLGTNHLGHFALTGLLLPALLGGGIVGGPARVVTVSSSLHRRGVLDRGDLMSERSYDPWQAYGRSKLANLLFMRELQRRADAAGARLLSLGAHPGFAATNLQAGPLTNRGRVPGLVMGVATRVFAQPAAQGAWPCLRAATDRGAHGGDYYGPSRFFEGRGSPVLVGMSAAASSADDAAWLWDRSVELTGVDYAALATAAR